MPSALTSIFVKGKFLKGKETGRGLFLADNGHTYAYRREDSKWHLLNTGLGKVETTDDRSKIGKTEEREDGTYQWQEVDETIQLLLVQKRIESKNLGHVRHSSGIKGRTTGF